MSSKAGISAELQILRVMLSASIGVVPRRWHKLSIGGLLLQTGSFLLQRLDLLCKSGILDLQRLSLLFQALGIVGMACLRFLKNGLESCQAEETRCPDQLKDLVVLIGEDVSMIGDTVRNELTGPGIMRQL